MPKLLDFRPDETVILRCWGRGIEVRVVEHDDCGLTTLQRLRTGTTWKMSSHTMVRAAAEEYARRVDLIKAGLITDYIGPKLGPEEWYGWRNGKRLSRAAELAEQRKRK